MLADGSIRVLVEDMYYKLIKVVVTLNWVDVFCNLKSLMSALTYSRILWCFSSEKSIWSYVSTFTQDKAGPEGATVIEHVTTHERTGYKQINLAPYAPPAPTAQRVH